MRIKNLFFSFLVIFAALFFWGTTALFFTNASLLFLFYLTLSWFIFLTLVLLFIPLINSRNLIYSSFILSGAGFFLFFRDFSGESFFYYLIGILFFILCLVISTELMLKEKSERLKFSLRRIWRRGIWWLITGMALIIALVYYFNPLLDVNQQEIKIPQDFFGLILKPASSVVGKIIPFYEPEMTIDQTLASNMLLSGNKNMSFSGLPPELINRIEINNFENINIGQLLEDPAIKSFIQEQTSQDKINPQLLAEQREQLSQTLGIELKGDETMEAVLANLVNSKINEFIGPNAEEISLGITVALFFALQLFGRILSILAKILGQIIFSLLLIFKIVFLKDKMRAGQVIEF